MDGFVHLLRALGVFFGALAAILIGTEAGSADISSGVFRDLVATGTERTCAVPRSASGGGARQPRFHAHRIWAWAGGDIRVRRSLPTPDLSLVLQGLGWVVLANSILAGLAVRVGSWSGSRAVTLTAVIGLQTVFTQLIVNVASLAAVRDALPSAALGQIIPAGSGDGVSMATGIAVAVLAGWALLPAALGAWRTRVRDA